jgi:uncharacterized lipoprotein YajG
MRKTYFFICVFILQLSLIGCALTTNIKLPEIQDQKTRQTTPVFIEFKNLPPDSIIAKVYPPSGKPDLIKNDSGSLEFILRDGLTKVLRNKGYMVTNEKSKSNLVLHVDIIEFSVDWRIQMFSKSKGNIKIDLKHSITKRDSTGRLWNWNYEYDQVHGQMFGNCTSVIFPPVGCIGLMMYGDTDTQLNNATTTVLSEYYREFSSKVPAAGKLK